MKFIEYNQYWDHHKSTHIILIHKDSIIGSLRLDFNDSGSIVIQELYVQMLYRGKGISHKLMQYILEKNIKNDLWLIVNRNNWVKSLYEKYGFEYVKKYDGENDWMKYKDKLKIK